MVERTLGHPGCGQYLVDTDRSKPLAQNDAPGDVEDLLAGIRRLADIEFVTHIA